MSTPSWSENESRDILSKAVSKSLAADFADECNEYTSPISADQSWWVGLPVTKVLNVYGEYEMLRDDIRTLGEKLRQTGLDVENVECSGQVHIDSILDAQFETIPGMMSTKTWEWLEMFS